ncbi:aroma-sacti cluster domain-containing protein [Streptomyces sp. NPDC006464]|uniref:aroma-sacti cluster domain-containing protein n=1 Tax=Streptomyces sp. NPDC006464 TaxID=3154305 RepID=UPI0033AAEA5D
MEQRNPEVQKQLKKAGMLSGCDPTEEQLAIIESLSSAEIDMLIGLKSRLNNVDQRSDCDSVGVIVW